MSHKEIDNVLTGIIILLLIMVVWKRMKGNSPYKNDNSMYLPCGCRRGSCRCRERVRTRQGGGMCCRCNRSKTRCLCGIRREGFDGKNVAENSCVQSCEPPIVGTPGYGPKIVSDDGDFSGDVIQKLSLEPSILQSQKDYIDGFGFSGLPTGSSHDTLLCEVGRSYGTADFVGLTQRKFCKARQLATPAPDARFVPTATIKEWCDIGMDELI